MQVVVYFSITHSNILSLIGFLCIAGILLDHFLLYQIQHPTVLLELSDLCDCVQRDAQGSCDQTSRVDVVQGVHQELIFVGLGAKRGKAPLLSMLLLCKVVAYVWHAVNEGVRDHVHTQTHTHCQPHASECPVPLLDRAPQSLCA